MRTAEQIARDHGYRDGHGVVEPIQTALDEARRHYEGEEVPYDSPRIKPGARVRIVWPEGGESALDWDKGKVLWRSARYFILADAPEPFVPTVGHVIASAYEAKACEGWVLILHGRAYQRDCGSSVRPWSDTCAGGHSDAEVVGGTLVWGPA
ncbi:hypothetical protein [uncultured Arsenicicoccus sp.]|uniref:hypothetical protein n=1 Tax=uncultured Arsenicicoccus sp. TaxID=491339 RepID=UPI002594C630|nr:hypothetical protein [uncultured Arsenicicoccus sp.]